MINRHGASQVALVIKNLSANAGDANHRFDPWVRKIPWSSKWQPTPVFLPGKFLGERSLAGYSPALCCAYHSVVSDSLQSHGLYSPPGSSIHGILQARTLPLPSLGGLPNPEIKSRFSCSPHCRRDSLLSESPELKSMGSQRVRRS